MKTLLNQSIAVTQKHIKRGKQIDCERCPIALAIKELRPGSRVFVSHASIRVNAVTYKTPVEARQFMNRFDSAIDKTKVRPVTFKLTERI